MSRSKNIVLPLAHSSSQSLSLLLVAPSIRPLLCATTFMLLASTLACAPLLAQAPATQAQATDSSAQKISNIEHRLNDVTDTLMQTQKALQQSLEEIKRLRSELDAVRGQGNTAAAAAPVEPAPELQPADSSAVSNQIQALQAIQEQQQILQAEIKQHEQTKLETASKYNLRVTGIALFNAFSNAGVVDNVELPSIAIPRVAGASHGSAGATLRQTIFGVEANGPAIGGAHSSASVNVDFFGGETTNSYGYTAASGVIRMRDAQLGLDWEKSTVQVGYTTPLISPRSPTSYATLAQPALAGSGNLWTWSPQVRFEQRLPLRDDHGLSMEAGLIFPPSSSYNAIQSDSPVGASRRPGVEGRIAYHSDRSRLASPHTLVFGVGAYKAYQYYSSSAHVNSWAVTGDWQIPLSKWVDLSGEIYRGRALGGLGGGLYKDIVVGTDYTTGLSRTVGVETAGGWSQLKLNFNARFEANAMFGLDNAFSSSFDSVILPPSTDPTATAVRNSSIVGNLIFRPRSSLIFSPEYRRLSTWRYDGPLSVANIFTLSAGYQF